MGVYLEIGRLPTSIVMPKHKTDLTPLHHPHEYELTSHNEDACGSLTGKAIYIGTKEQCETRLEEVKHHDAEYGAKCVIRPT